MRTSQRRLSALLVAVLLVVAALVLIGAHAEQSACEAKGGKRLRGAWAWDDFECYEASALKVLH